MDQPQDILAIIERLKDLIPLRDISNPSDSSTGNISTASSCSSHPVLPSSIPHLPVSAATLPDGPPSSSTATGTNTTATATTTPLSHTTSLLKSHILPYLNLGSLSPNYYGFVTGGATPAALLADWLVSYYDQNVHVHLPRDTITTSVEVAALNLLVDLFRLPSGDWGVGKKASNGGGVLTTGATASNVVGLALGREWVVRERARRNRVSGSRSTTSTGSDSAVTVTTTNATQQGVRVKDEENEEEGEEEAASIAHSGLLSACSAARVTSIQILSTLPHSSITKSLSILGLGRSSVIPIGQKSNPLSIDIGKLTALAQQSASTGTAYILTISAGEINTGRFATSSGASLREVREICDKYGIWIHVDGAFGLFARVLMGPEGRAVKGEYEELVRGVEGLELADSITGDGHKLLNVPYDCGIALTRHKWLSEVVFRNGNAAYLNMNSNNAGNIVNNNGAEGSSGDVGEQDEEQEEIQSPLNIGIENSRRFRALPVYATLMAYGRSGYVDMLERQVGLARRVVRWMWDISALQVLPDGRESLGDVLGRTFMVVLFRARDEKVNEELVERINATGKMYVSGTVWKGKKAARIAVSNWRTDVKRDGDLIEKVILSCLKIQRPKD